MELDGVRLKSVQENLFRCLGIAFSQTRTVSQLCTRHDPRHMRGWLVVIGNYAADLQGRELKFPLFDGCKCTFDGVNNALITFC